MYSAAYFDYYFLDEQWYDLHQWIWRTRYVAGFATVLAIFIACLGLFGVVSINVGQRTKEIGVRKVLGASIGQMIMLLSKEYTLLIVVANLIAWPLAYFVMQDWLEDFAHRIELSPLYFIGASVIALLIAWGTVSLHAVRAALTRPAIAMRYE